jgi:ferrous iron transport protein B
LNAVSAYYDLDTEAEDFDEETALSEMSAVTGEKSAVISIEDEETLELSDFTVYFSAVPENAEENVIEISYLEAVDYFKNHGFEEPDPAQCQQLKEIK